MSDDDKQPSRYSEAGVDIDAGTETVRLMRSAIRSTFNVRVLSEVGTFGGLFDARHLGDEPVLVASMDGVGTKTMVAARMNRWRGIGIDLVNHCINDVLVQGARPLFFLDYVAASKLDPLTISEIVGGMAQACRAAGCALLGGETAEMPGVYAPGQIDVVGTVVGVVSRSELLTGELIKQGDALIGLASSGLHTNGYTLARTALADLDWSVPRRDLEGYTIGQLLLEPHRTYLPAITRLRDAGITLRGMAHITGGGLLDNLPRILPEGLGARMRQGAWPVPPIFDLIASEGKVPPAEMQRVFNMGLGMVIVVPPGEALPALEALSDDPATLDDEGMLVGEVVIGKGVQIV